MRTAPLSLQHLIELLHKECGSVGPKRMAEILHQVSIAPDDLQPYVLFSDSRYARNLVHKTAGFEIMVMCWHSGQRSSIHDHSGSLGGLKIVAGELTESLFVKAANGMIKSSNSVEHTAGEVRVEETSLIHQISNLQAGRNAISLHIYVPPLTRMNVYSLEDPTVKNVLPQYFNFGAGI